MREIRTYNTEYDSAFKDYLRYGIDIIVPYYIDELETKATKKYIWRTIGDNKVRLSHAENNGKIFDINNPPDTGHPRQDVNCRCIAEPYIEGISEFANQNISSELNDADYMWDDIDLGGYYRSNIAKNLTLREIGHLRRLINYYFYGLGVMNQINNQIIDEARKNDHIFTYNFRKSYKFFDFEEPFAGEIFSFGSGVVGGKFEGRVERNGNIMKIEGKIKYEYTDEFTDPVDLREIFWPGTSSMQTLKDTLEIIYELGLKADKGAFEEKLNMLNKDNRKPVKQALEKLFKPIKGLLARKLLRNWLKKVNSKEEFINKAMKFTDRFGTAFTITDTWETEFQAEAKINRDESRYFFEDENKHL